MNMGGEVEFASKGVTLPQDCSSRHSMENHRRLSEIVASQGVVSLSWTKGVCAPQAAIIVTYQAVLGFV